MDLPVSASSTQPLVVPIPNEVFNGAWSFQWRRGHCITIATVSWQASRGGAVDSKAAARKRIAMATAVTAKPDALRSSDPLKKSPVKTLGSSGKAAGLLAEGFTIKSTMKNAAVSLSAIQAHAPIHTCTHTRTHTRTRTHTHTHTHTHTRW